MTTTDKELMHAMGIAYEVHPLSDRQLYEIERQAHKLQAREAREAMEALARQRNTATCVAAAFALALIIIGLAGLSR